MTNASGQHAETLYALKKSSHGKGETQISYLMQPSVKQLWDTIVEEEWLGTGQTVQTLRAAGWRAVKVSVVEIMPPRKSRSELKKYRTRICQDCGRHGELTGHMDCMYPGGAT